MNNSISTIFSEGQDKTFNNGIYFIKSQYINKDQNNKYKEINFIQNHSNR
jgi:hypothetical protein